MIRQVMLSVLVQKLDIKSRNVWVPNSDRRVRRPRKIWWDQASEVQKHLRDKFWQMIK